MDISSVAALKTQEKKCIYTQRFTSLPLRQGHLKDMFIKKKDVVELGDMNALSGWIDNIIAAYDHLPDEAIKLFQDSCDRTMGRAILSLAPVLGEDHNFISKLKSIIKGSIPASPDDFNKEKWFQS